MNIYRENPQKALEYLKEAEKLDPLNKEVYINKILVYLHLV